MRFSVLVTAVFLSAVFAFPLTRDIKLNTFVSRATTQFASEQPSPPSPPRKLELTPEQKKRIKIWKGITEAARLCRVFGTIDPNYEKDRFHYRYKKSIGEELGKMIDGLKKLGAV